MKHKVDIELFKVNPDNFTDDNKPVINGGQGTVTFMTDTTTQKAVVLKQSKESLKKRHTKKSFYKEVEIFAIAHHLGVVKFVGWCETKKHKGNIYLELAEKGSLFDLIEKSKKVEPDSLWDNTHKLIISYGVANTMKYLHSLGILHRDLKCENILLDADLNPLISDFGTSTLTSDEIIHSTTIKQTTVQIMPPEFLEDYEKYNRILPIDVYSYAIVLYCLWTEEDPYPGLTTLQIVEKTLLNQRPIFSSKSQPSKSWRDLIQQCWEKDPGKRPTFSEICKRLESPEFLTPDINVSLFNSYKEKVRKFNESDEKAENAFIRKLKNRADEGDPESQLSYALRLYNGLTVPKDQTESCRYFKLSADQGNNDAQFYYSLILERKGDIEGSSKYYQESLNSQLVPEANSKYAQQLISEGKVDESLPYLHNALQRSSISALLLYANLCEKDPKYGCSEIFYEMAASCCHCLDTVGFYFPVDYKVYKCKKCNVEICEGCAKHCHKGHPVVEIGVKNSFVCDCGKNHFNKHCSIEFVGKMECEGKPFCYQHLYRCRDCSNDPDLLICKACAEKCHKDHDVIDCGIVRGFCSCGAKCLTIIEDEDQKAVTFKCNASHYPDLEPSQCSRKVSPKKIDQRWFQCMSCGLYGSDQQGVCQSCALKCHKGHLLLDRGVKKRCCGCKETGKCKF